MRQALDAIRDTARMAWWDGSALGLRLNRLIDIFDLAEPERGDRQAEARS